MKLLAPEVLGPLSICSKKAWIRANISGATIHIHVNGTEVESHATTKCDGTYLVGATLQPNDSVTVRQTLAGDSSGESLPVIVQDAPAELSALTLHTSMYACGRALQVSGGLPGAKVEGRIGNSVVGSADVLAGWARFSFDPTLGVGEKLSLKQTACNGETSSQSTPSAIAPPSPLPAPTIQEPLIECQTSIAISGVADGAYVELYRNGTLEKTFTFATPSEWRWIKKLKKNDKIEVRQGFKCKKESPQLESFSGKAVAIVKDVGSLPKTSILGTPCPGTTYVTISNLVIGARVVLQMDGEELGQTDAPDSTFTFNTPPLKPNAELTAFMVLCDKKGPAGKKKVSDKPHVPTGLKLSDLYACAAYVYVYMSGTSGNSLLYVTNEQGQQISGYHNLIGFNRLIPVNPSLVVGDELTVHLLGCGGSWKEFGPFAVGSGAPPPPKFYEPMESHRDSVIVGSDHCGAKVDVWVNNVWSGSAISLGNLGATVVQLANELVTGDSVHGTQTLCGKSSRPSKKIKVAKPRPEQPVLSKPADESTGVPVQPTFEWSDPGAGDENAAESFQLVVKQGSSTVIDTTTNGTSMQPGAVLEHDRDFEWTVVAKNSTGTTAANVNFEFHTVDAPASEPADLKFVPPIYSGTLGFPRNELFSVFIDVHNDGDETSMDYEVLFELVSTDQSTLYDSQSVPMPALDAGDTASPGASIEIHQTNSVRLNAYLIVNGQQVESAFRVI